VDSGCRRAALPSIAGKEPVRDRRSTVKDGGAPLQIPKDRAERLVCQLFEKAGVEANVARLVAVALVEAELEGSAAHGLLQVPVYVRRVLAGTIAKTAEPTELHRTGAISVFDAGLALGHAAAEQLAGIAIAEAHQHGLAAAAARSATHFGVAGRYARMIAEAGIVGIVMCNTRPMMPVPGGRTAVVGNNPLAISVPCAGQPPIVFDMAMSAAAMGRIRQAAQEGQPIPEGWAVDAAGRDTTDAEMALEGVLLPAGGPKGFGLALMIDLLCALSGGAAGSEIGVMHGDPEAKWECSWFFLALDPARFGLDQPYAERVAALAEQVRRSAPDPAVALPGDRRRAAMVAAGDMVTLAPRVAASLEALSQELGGAPLFGTGS
jgi:LDH2 family malate/lactate/ureidoglycolate dehydrogenase